jgi:hypothetical protein
VEALSKDAENEGLVLIGYGDESYEKEWGELFDEVAEYVKKQKGITEHTYGWCGHIAHYNPDETTVAINEVLEKKQTAVVIPVLVAFDETFQVKIIGALVACKDGNKETWREVAKWAAGQLRSRFGEQVSVQYFDLFDPDCPKFPPESQLPVVFVDEMLISSGGKISIPLIRKKIEELGTYQ